MTNAAFCASQVDYSLATRVQKQIMKPEKRWPLVCGARCQITASGRGNGLWNISSNTRHLLSRHTGQISLRYPEVVWILFSFGFYGSLVTKTTAWVGGAVPCRMLGEPGSARSQQSTTCWRLLQERLVLKLSIAVTISNRQEKLFKSLYAKHKP